MVTATGCQRSQSFTLTATDLCGNHSECVVTYTWKVDTTAPVFTGCPTASINLHCNPAASTHTCVTALALVTANDDCDGSITPTCSAGMVTATGCQRSQSFTLTATDLCGNHSECVVTYTWREDTTPPVLAKLPTGGDLGCNPTPPVCATEVTANDNCDGAVQVRCTPGAIQNVGTCGRSQSFTYSAVDSCDNEVSAVVTYTWTVDITKPVITCKDFFCVKSDGACADHPDASMTGTPTVSDNCTHITLTSNDVAKGTCPKVITRTWTATDDCGNSASCDQIITCCCTSSLITDTVRCTLLPTSCSAANSFRLLFTPDVSNPGCLKLNASNPGQFYYNVFYTGTPGISATFNITIPYPFVTQGNNPVEGYDGVTMTTSGGQTCLLPGNKFLAGTNKVFIMDYSPQAFGSTRTLTVTVTVPASGVVFLAIHLDYGLKGTTGYSKSGTGNDAVLCNTTTVVIPDMQTYNFSVGGATSDSASALSCNAFKKNPGVGGGAKNTLTSYGVSGASATLKDSKGALIASGVTDEDGWYMINYKHTGKSATFYVTLTPPGGRAKTQTITLKANSFAEANFTVP